MSKQKGSTTAHPTNLSQQPPVLAWKRLDEKNALPTSIQTMKRKVFRLVGAGPGRSNVIAKRCRNDGMVEMRVYEDILPHVRLKLVGGQ